MKNQTEVSAELKEEKRKKSVSWVDGKDEGKMSRRFLQKGVAATRKSELLDEEIAVLMAKGYAENEAYAIVGKSTTSSGKNFYLDPVFYDTREKIDAVKAAEKRYAFFSDVGFVAVATAATLMLIKSLR